MVESAVGSRADAQVTLVRGVAGKRASVVAGGDQRQHQVRVVGTACEDGVLAAEEVGLAIQWVGMNASFTGARLSPMSCSFFVSC